MHHAELSSLAISFPKQIRTNEYWNENFPQLVDTARDRALSRLWDRYSERSIFEKAMAPYHDDPFKGALERRVVTDEGSLDLGCEAAQAALEAAHIEPSQIDLVLASGMRPDTHAVGDGAFLGKRLELSCPSINLETACSSSVVGLDMAHALVASGHHERVLVVTTCTYSRDVDPTSTLSWFLADGAGAFVVQRSEEPGWLSSRIIPTSKTCGAFVNELTMDNGVPAFRMRATEGAGAVLHDTARPYLETCCRQAVVAAGLRLKDIDFFVFNTPTAWYADFGAELLGIPREKTISTYPIYTNIGPALMPVNLFHAVESGRIRVGHNILLYSVGSASTAAAVVMRWGECALGPKPPPSKSVHSLI